LFTLILFVNTGYSVSGLLLLFIVLLASEVGVVSDSGQFVLDTLQGLTVSANILLHLSILRYLLLIDIGFDCFGLSLGLQFS